MFYTWNQSNMSQHDVLTEKNFEIVIVARKSDPKTKNSSNQSCNSLDRGDRTDFAQN